ncbi:hypothetical protein [Lactiplantibacillus paraxiangfangensis]|uniref:hypothetical protein n=1 Tax=Lactiplantibacillus paraxiangfangensis TaxID=3076224 RepID=UPI0030C757BC
MSAQNNGADGTNYLAKIIKETIGNALTGVNVSFIAEVVKVSPPTVSVQPLSLTVESNQKQGIIEKALVLCPSGTGKVKLKPDDHVVCVVLDHDTTYYNRKEFFRQMTTTPHLVNNAVVIGKVANKEDFE